MIIKEIDKGITSDDHRLQFDVSKPVTDNLKLRKI